MREVYTEDDLAPGLAERLGAPGAPPFTRGPYPTMYRGRLWTMRQFAGFGSPEEANERFHFLLERGQTALSVAFDLPTQLGYDSGHPVARPEVGRVGVAIDTADDMVDLFDGLPLDQVSVNFTINATAPIILAMYLVAAERQGVAEEALAGTLQNDILKEFLARKTFVFPPEPSMRLSCDVIEFASGRLPRFNPISITGYHAREAGCDAVQELALTLASAIAYSEALVARGLDFDSFAPRLSFHFATTMDLFEEVAKLRAARRMWYRIATERFGAKDPNSGRLRFFSGNSGTTLTAQQPLNNIIRSTIQCLGRGARRSAVDPRDGLRRGVRDPVGGGGDALAPDAADRRPRVGRASDGGPLGRFVLRGDADRRARGARQRGPDGDRRRSEARWRRSNRACRNAGSPQSAYRIEREIADGTRPRVGVNVYADPGETSAEMPELFALDPSIVDRQVARTAARVAARDQAACADATAVVEAAARDGANVMPSLIDAVRAGATLGELSDVFRSVFGEFREPHPW